jgi:hypothetical protein
MNGMTYKSRSGPRHEVRRSRRTSVVSVLRVLLSIMVCIAAFVVGVVIAGTTGGVRPDAPRWQQPGFGAIVVGMSFGMLALLACMLAASIRERRHQLNARLSSLDMPWYSVLSSVVQRPVGLAMLLVVVLLFILIGFWLRHRYG